MKTSSDFQIFSQSPRGCRTILVPQGSSALCTIDLPAFAECPEASCCCVRFCHCCRFSLHDQRQDISRSRVHFHDEFLYVVSETRTHSPCSSAVEIFPNLSHPPKLDWFALDLLRPTLLLTLSAQGTVTSLTRDGRDLVADFAVVALAAMLDATVDSKP